MAVITTNKIPLRHLRVLDILELCPRSYEDLKRITRMGAPFLDPVLENLKSSEFIADRRTVQGTMISITRLGKILLDSIRDPDNYFINDKGQLEQKKEKKVKVSKYVPVPLSERKKRRGATPKPDSVRQMLFALFDKYGYQNISAEAAMKYINERKPGCNFDKSNFYQAGQDWKNKNKPLYKKHRRTFIKKKTEKKQKEYRKIYELTKKRKKMENERESNNNTEK
jgi:hypothetical protein